MTALPIDLPEGFSPLVSIGDIVTPGQTLAQKATSKDEVVNVLQGLKISRSQAKKMLKKGPGDRITPGDIIAIKKNFFGKVTATITSGISGEILRYERDTGNLVVRTDEAASSLIVISPVAGTISLCNNREIVIQTEDALVSSGVALGSDAQGNLTILEESFDTDGSKTLLYYLDSRAKGKIVIIQTITSDILVKGASIGVSGFLVVNLSNENIAYYQEKTFQLPVLEIDTRLIEPLERWRDKNILIDTKSKAIILQE